MRHVGRVNDVPRTENHFNFSSHWQVEFTFHDLVIVSSSPSTQALIVAEFRDFKKTLTVALESVELILFCLVHRIRQDGQIRFIRQQGFNLMKAGLHGRLINPVSPMISVLLLVSMT